MKTIPQASAEHLVLPKIPIEAWLSAESVGKEFFVSGPSVLLWRRRGFIPRAYLKKFGKVRFKFHPAVVPFLYNKIEEAHSRRRAARLQPARSGAAE